MSSGGSAKYMWVITHDYLHEKDKDLSNDAGVIGPCKAPTSMSMPHRFRMYDDDNELYYEGVCSEESFDPLDDFGTPNAGCTRIDYFNPSTHTWEIL
jgi:hypothetical protein